MTTQRKQWVSWEEFYARFPDLAVWSSIDFQQIGGLTPGSIPFGDADGLLDEDNTNLFWDAANAFLGIHETTPTALVHINSVGGAIPALNLESGAEGELVTPDGQQLRFGHWNGADTFTERMKIDAAGTVFISYLTVASVLFAGANGEIKQDNADFYWDTANKRLGVGKAPSNVLDVEGVGTVTGGNSYGGVVARFHCTEAKHTSISIDAVAGKDPVLYFAEGGVGIWDVRNDASETDEFQIRYQVGEVNRTDFKIDNAGNVSITTGNLTVTGGTIAATTAKLSNLTDGYVPYHVDDATGLADSPIAVVADGIRINEPGAADYIDLLLDGTDAFFSWSDGALNLQTTEADSITYVDIHGNGTGRGYLRIYDEDDAEHLAIYVTAGKAHFRTVGANPTQLSFQTFTALNILFWDGLTEGNPYFYIYGWNTAAGAIVSNRFQMSDANDEFLIEAQNSVNHEGITISLLETNQRFRVRQNADYMAMYLTATDAYLTWSDGALNLQTEETDTTTIIHIHGAGTGYGRLHIYDEDDAENLILSCQGSIGYISTGGATPGAMKLQHLTVQDILCWQGITEGNPDFFVYGWITAGGATRYGRFRMDDVNDEFLIEAENSVNHEGITINLLETNQRFRVRQNSDYMAMYCTATDAYLVWSDGVLNLITDEGVNTPTFIFIKGKGTEEGNLRIYDEDDAEYLSLFATGGSGYISTGGVTPGRLYLQQNITQDIYCWAGIPAGNPNFYIFGWHATDVDWMRMGVEADGDALIEAENNLNIVAGGGGIFFGNENIGINQSSFGDNAVGVLGQGNGTAPTTSPADCFQMYSADIGGVAGKAGAHFRDEEGNVVSIGSGGVLMSGTARVIKKIYLNNAAFTKGATAPTQIILGNLNAWSFDIGDDAVMTVMLPPDWAAGTLITIKVCWYIDEAYAADKEVQWRVDWSALPHDFSETVDTPTHSGQIDSGDIDIPAVAKRMGASTIGTIAGANLSADDMLGFTLSRIAVTNDNPTADPAIHHLIIEYTANKLGAAT